MLLTKAATKNIPETTLILVVVLGGSKLTPIVITNANVRKAKLPILKSILFSLS